LKDSLLDQNHDDAAVTVIQDSSNILNRQQMVHKKVANRCFTLRLWAQLADVVWAMEGRLQYPKTMPDCSFF
jgi:hypothetical protein